jgi:L-amino acid N-acyltransferase YncA
MLVRPATKGDSRDLWEWRNDPLTRAMSVNTALVSWEAHQAWYADILNDEQHVVLIGEMADAKLGMCRFDIVGPKAEVSINLNPSMRGRGLSVPFLKLAVDFFADTHRRPLVATIRTCNTASIRCFEDSGFVQIGREEGYVRYGLAP